MKRRGVAVQHTEVLPITSVISRQAADLIDALASHITCAWPTPYSEPPPSSMALALLTANTKRFGAAEDLQLEAFAP